MYALSHTAGLALALYIFSSVRNWKKEKKISTLFFILFTRIETHLEEKRIRSENGGTDLQTEGNCNLKKRDQRIPYFSFFYTPKNKRKKLLQVSNMWYPNVSIRMDFNCCVQILYIVLFCFFDFLGSFSSAKRFLSVSAPLTLGKMQELIGHFIFMHPFQRILHFTTLSIPAQSSNREKTVY